MSEEDVARARSGTEPALSNEELARLGIGGIDLLYGVDGSWLPPVQTNGVLRKYLTDDYRFHSAMFIYPFVNCLTNVNTQNPLWVCTISSHHLRKPFSSTISLLRIARCVLKGALVGWRD